MEELDNQLDILIERLENSIDFKNDLEKLNSVYPFSKYEYIISALLANKKLTFDEYLDIRNEYLNRNLYLSVLEISAPRGFGDTWAFGHLLSTEPALKRPTKKLDIAYKGEYDLFLEWKSKKTDHFIKIEVKASRATDRTKPDEHLNVKALSSHSDSAFLMNFQQLKPKCCDVFLWLAVYRDLIKYLDKDIDKLYSVPAGRYIYRRQTYKIYSAPAGRHIYNASKKMEQINNVRI